MEMQPPPPSVVVGAAVVKRFPGYGIHRGTIAEINGGKAIVHWSTTDERTTLWRLVPRETTYKRRGSKRRRDEPAAAAPSPPPRARRARRAVDYAAMEDPEFEGG